MDKLIAEYRNQKQKIFKQISKLENINPLNHNNNIGKSQQEIKERISNLNWMIRNLDESIYYMQHGHASDDWNGIQNKNCYQLNNW